MNIINKALMRAALVGAPLYRRMGADTNLVTAILKTKLTLDDRTPNSLQQVQRRGSNKPVTMATLGAMAISALMGVLYLFAFGLGTDPVTQLTFYFSMFFVLLSSMLIADFTSVLLDVRDNVIILTRPVNDATFLTARLLHILIHLTKLVLPMSLPGAIYIGYNHGIGLALWFFVVVMLLILFTIFFINAVYLVVMRLVSPQRFQAIISFVQIGLAIGMYASYQLLPALLGDFSNLELHIGIKWFAPLLPPFWFASVWQLLNGSVRPLELAGAIAGIILPLVAIWLVVRFLAQSFIRQLTLSANRAAAETPQKLKRTRQGTALSEIMANILAPRGLRRVGFLFTWRLSGRSRDFRLQVLPAIGYLLVFVVITFYRSFQKGRLESDESFSKVMVLSVLYFGLYVLVVALVQMKFSEKWKASWMFFATPVAQPGQLIVGGFLAMVAKFYLPLAVLVLIASLYISGPVILPNVIFGLANQLLIASLLVYINQRQLPFSLPQQTSNKGGNFLRSLAVLFIAGLIGSAHYLLYNFLPVVVLCCILSVVAFWLVLNSLLKTSWEVIVKGEE